MQNYDIMLGPLVGLEADTTYTIIIVTREELDVEQLDLSLEWGHSSQKHSAIFLSKLYATFAYKFIFDVSLESKAYQVGYSVCYNNKKLENRTLDSDWAFIVPAKNDVPKIGFASCNGNSKKMPEYQSGKNYVMWESLYAAHMIPGGDYNFHGLIFGGDQIYADPIWKEVKYFKKNGLLKRKTNEAIINHVVDGADLEGLEAELDRFYERLYIESWSKPIVAKVLAAIPSVMMWDDHDIFDGWGSHPEDLQKSQLFKIIFKVAKKYFEILQIRGENNKSRISFDDYTLQFRFRNYEIFALDNRSHRTEEQVMSFGQFEALEAHCEKTLFENLSEPLKDNKVLLFAIAVPIAHLNYKERTERFLKLQRWFNFRYSFHDDALDHWDHSNHETQQKRLLDFIFALSDHAKPKYTHIISGDVHSAGAGRIVIQNSEGAKVVNEFVSSPLVYKPVCKIIQWILKKLSDQHSKVQDYQIGVHKFGFKGRQSLTVYERNYGFFYKPAGRGLMAYFTYESNKAGYEPYQPSSYLRANEDVVTIDDEHLYKS